MDIRSINGGEKLSVRSLSIQVNQNVLGQRLCIGNAHMTCVHGGSVQTHRQGNGVRDSRLPGVDTINKIATDLLDVPSLRQAPEQHSQRQ